MGDKGMGEIWYTLAQNNVHVIKGLGEIVFSSTRVRLLPCFSTLSTGLSFFHSTHAFSNSFICRSHLFIHVQTTTPTATVTIQLPIISLSIVASTSLLDNTYIITGSSYHLSACLTHFSLEENKSKWQYIPVAPCPHVISGFLV